MILKRLPIVVLLLALTASATSAYTLVMRDGRRVAIPNEFVVTSSTLTYEVSAGIQITVQLTSIDIGATERANGQTKGALLQMSVAPKATPEQTQSRPKSAQSITNLDLEVYRQARVQNELAYEKRRQELGLPSLAEQRKELVAVAERTQQQLLNMRSEEAGSEGYWRGRAAALRGEMTSNQAQIDFVRLRLDEIPLTYSFGAFSTTVPFGTVASPVFGSPVQNLITPNVFAPSLVGGTRVGATVGFGPARRSFSGAINSGRFQRRDGGRFSPFARGAVVALPFQSLDYSLERFELSNQLNQLQIVRAGLRARWRELEEEARRAGAYPGWLRP